MPSTWYQGCLNPVAGTVMRTPGKRWPSTCLNRQAIWQSACSRCSYLCHVAWGTTPHHFSRNNHYQPPWVKRCEADTLSNQLCQQHCCRPRRHYTSRMSVHQGKQISQRVCVLPVDNWWQRLFWPGFESPPFLNLFLLLSTNWRVLFCPSPQLNYLFKYQATFSN